VTRADIKEFVFPSQVINYAGSSGVVGAMLQAQGVRTGAVGVVADRVVHENGLTEALLKGLADVGYEPHVFAEIAGEPDLEVVEKAAAVVGAAGAVAFVGLGGGSALDTAKWSRGGWRGSLLCTAPRGCRRRGRRCG
jgi:alcohol dehydrogenase class IV